MTKLISLIFILLLSSHFAFVLVITILLKRGFSRPDCNDNTVDSTDSIMHSLTGTVVVVVSTVVVVVSTVVVDVES